MRFAMLLLSAAVVAQVQTPPVPKPFPGAAAGVAPPPSAPTTTQRPSPAPQVPPAPAALDPQLAGVPIYPTADFLESVDAGQNQRYFLFGTNGAFADVVAFYKTTLRTGGRELFKTPGMQQFDLGRFQEQSMAYPPSIVVKDYVWNGSTGYLHVQGRTEKRYPTVIQIVPR